MNGGTSVQNDGSGRSADPYKIIVGCPYWTLNGVTIFSLNLVRGLLERGVDARILLTEEDCVVVDVMDPPVRRPPEIRFDELPVEWWEGWGAHWGALARYLERQAPCIYIPNSDYRHSCVSPLLSEEVAIVGIVHSDDPLHYDHVSRLGRFWDATACVSRTLNENVASLCPEIRDRLRTIPIGIAIPGEMAARGSGDEDTDTLRVIYHGVLKQHQKRILDLPKIVEATAARGVPIELTIAGGGPEEKELRAAARSLVDRGLVRFLGVVPHDRIPELLGANDVYLLVSEFEGMPNALLEAMANGCVPVVSEMKSGVPELVLDGETGLLAPIGDIEAFADRLASLHEDPGERRRIGSRAYEAVRRGAFSRDEMVDAYVDLFDRVAPNRREKPFRRPAGELVPPPAEVSGVEIFPLEITHVVDGVGRFPYRSDYEAFRRRISGEPRVEPDEVAIADLEVIVGVPNWEHHWSNVLLQGLLRGLAERGATARLLLTHEHPLEVPRDALRRLARQRSGRARLAYPPGAEVDRLPVAWRERWGGRWAAMIRYLEERAPCIYLPTYDWKHSCVAPLLSDEVMIVGLVTEVGVQLEQALHQGAYWDAVVATHDDVAWDLERKAPELADRLETIPRGLDVPEEVPEKDLRAAAPLRLTVLAVAGDGRLPEDLQQVLDCLKKGSVAVEVTVLESSGAIGQDDLARFFERTDVVLSAPESSLISEDVLESMGQGCIPFLLDRGYRPFYPIVAEEVGVVAAAGDPQAAVASLAALSGDQDRRRAMSADAHRAARRFFRIEDMTRRYLELFVDLARRRDGPSYRRPRGELEPPPAFVAGVELFPMKRPYERPGVGRFPSKRDYRLFRRRLCALEPAPEPIERLDRV